MSSVNIHTNMDDLPRVLQNFADQLPYATSIALNNTAFGLMRHEKTEMARTLDLKNTWTQRGMRVEKASKRSLKARVGNVRWWMESLVEGGERRPRIGITHNGRRYLLVPADDMKTSSGKLRKFKSKKPFVIEAANGRLMLVYRKTKKRLPLKVVGKLVAETDYDAETYPHEQIASEYIAGHFNRYFREAMISAARSAR